MQSSLRRVLLSAVAWLRACSQKRQDNAQEHRDHRNAEERSGNDGPAAAADMPRAEWLAFQATIREIHEDEKQQHITERNTWAAQLRTSDRLNRITAIGTAVGVVGSVGIIGSLIIAKDAADDGHIAAIAAKQSADVAIAGSRAWVAPTKADLGSEVVANQPITINVEYQNVGKEPALSVRTHYAIGSYPDTFLVDGSIRDRIENDPICNNVSIKEGADIVWQNNSSGYSLIFTVKPAGDGAKIINETAAGDHSLFLRLCFAYLSASDKTVIHHTAFCYQYGKSYSAGLHMNICDEGHRAD